MARRRAALLSRPIPLLFIQFIFLTLVHGQANGSFVDQSVFTNFELFKNTGLQPCPINTSVPTTARMLRRNPKGGRGGGGGGGGSYSAGGSNGGNFIESTWIGNQDKYCARMKGTPIMIPSLPTQYAFTPWWPTFTAQLVSLFFTWAGLWWTTRTVEKEGAQDMKVPITFWVQLPVDIARILAWFVKTFHGFAEAKRFSWVSVILWLVPFNYIWLMRLFDAKKATTSTVSWQHAQQTTGYGPNMVHNKTNTQEPHVEEAVVQNSQRRKTKWFLLSLLFAFITGLMWLLSLVVVGLHFKYSWFDKKSHPTYVEVAKALSDPAILAKGIPEGCVKWIKNNSSTVSWQLLDLRIIQTVHVLIAAVQFVVCTVVVVFKQGGRHYILGKLKVSACASFATLGLPAIGLGFWILGTVVYGNQDEWMTYTNNLNTTSGCTFGAVAMSRQWGFWDVEYERGYRVAMSLLGAS